MTNRISFVGRTLRVFALVSVVAGCRQDRAPGPLSGRATARPSEGSTAAVAPELAPRWLLHGMRPWDKPTQHFSDRLVRIGERGLSAEIALSAPAAWTPSPKLLRLCNVPALGKGLALITVAGDAISAPRYIGIDCGGWWAPQGGYAVTPRGAEWIIGDFLTGSSMRRIAPPLQFADEPRWSPTGRYVWTRSVWGARPEARWLTAIAEDLSLEPLRAGDWKAWPSCAWSPALDRLACRGHRDREGQSEQGLLLFSADGSEKNPRGRLIAELSPLPGGRFVSGLSPPRWAGPDWIVLGGTGWSVEDPGVERRFSGRLVPSPRHPVVAYTHERTLHIAHLDSAAEVELDDPELEYATSFFWSPDGNHLLVERSDSTSMTIWLLPRASSLSASPRRISFVNRTQGAVRASFTPGSAWVWHHRAVRVSAGCDRREPATEGRMECLRHPQACEPVSSCDLHWIASVAHHVATGEETKLGPQGDALVQWAPDDNLMVESLAPESGARGRLVIRRARRAALEPIGRIAHDGQVRFSWQP